MTLCCTRVFYLTDPLQRPPHAMLSTRIHCVPLSYRGSWGCSTWRVPADVGYILVDNKAANRLCFPGSGTPGEFVLALFLNTNAGGYVKIVE
jgi:hypothetical protein